MSSLDALHDWHDFFVVIGAASGGLLGAMFVVASIGSGFLTKKDAAATRVFLTPTVIHMATVMFGCALAVVPSLERVSFGLVFGLGGLVGLIYSCAIGLNVKQRREIDAEDRLWYAALPILGYAGATVAALLVLWRKPAGLEILAAALVLLLAVGIRNAWDMILFFVLNARRSN
ncbi:MAG: hypothetical protein ACLPL5_01340 [Stellaceae bacterium]|jgi:hypothetical protein